MNLKINSTTAQLYRWFYSTSRMPQNLCPYFWKLVLMWVFILPYSIISLPSILMERMDRSESRSTGERAGIGFVMWLILAMLICMLSYIALFFVAPIKESLFAHMIGIGAAGWVISIVIGAIEFSKWVKIKWENRGVKYDENGYRIWEPVKEKEPSIIKEFAKAKYNKYCPKIDWDYKK